MGRARNRAQVSSNSAKMAENGEASGSNASSSTSASSDLKPSSAASEAKEAKNFLRGFFFLSGTILSGSLYLEPQNGNNYCLWFTMNSINAFTSFFASAQPQILGTKQHFHIRPQSLKDSKSNWYHFSDRGVAILDGCVRFPAVVFVDHFSDLFTKKNPWWARISENFRSRRQVTNQSNVESMELSRRSGLHQVRHFVALDQNIKSPSEMEATCQKVRPTTVGKYKTSWVLYQNVRSLIGCYSVIFKLFFRRLFLGADR